MTGRIPRRARRLAVAGGIAFLAVALAVAATAGLAGNAAAGDNVAVVAFEPDELEVEPGETVAVDVTLRSHGEYGDAGVRRIVLRVDYPRAYLSVTDVEAGDWFHDAPDDPEGEGDGEIEVRESTASDDDRGAVRVDQSLADPDDGVTGTATVATFTFEVNGDADAASVELAAAESEVHLTSRYPQPLSTTPATLHVDGGGDVVSPERDDEAFADEGAGSSKGDGDAADDGGNVDGDSDDGGSTDGVAGDGGASGDDGENGGDAEADGAGADGDEDGGDDAGGSAPVAALPVTGDAAVLGAVATALGAVAATFLLRRR